MLRSEGGCVVQAIQEQSASGRRHTQKFLMTFDVYGFTRRNCVYPTTNRPWLLCNAEDIPNGLVAGKAKDRFRGRGTLSDGRMVKVNFLEENRSKLSQIKCTLSTFER